MSLGAFSRIFIALILASTCSLAFAKKDSRQLKKWEQEAIAQEEEENTPEETAQELPAQPDYVVEPANGEGIDIYVDKTSQTMEVYYSGQVQFRYPVSTARYGYTTPNGDYKVQSMELMHYSKKYHHSPMPHSLFFRGGYALHGSYAKGFPRYASHGCVRLPPAYAEELYNFVASFGNGHADVHISGLNAPAPREKRNVSLDTQVETDTHGQTPEQTQAPKKKKKGFVENLFSGSKKQNTDNSKVKSGNGLY